MRSQAAKPLPKKGPLAKTSFKASTATKQVKKKAVATKKVKTLQKSTTKSPKKNTSDESKKDNDSSNKEKNDSTSDTEKAGPSKTINIREESPMKKGKKDPKEAKDKNKAAPKKVLSKKPIKLTKKANPAVKTKKDSDEVKYKINLESVKKTSAKNPKAKTNIKKSNTGNQKKKSNLQSKESEVKTLDKHDEDEKCPKDKVKDSSNISTITENKEDKPDKDIAESEKKSEKKEESNKILKGNSNFSETAYQSITVTKSTTQSETQKTETERPPKFFTSIRSPRTVDIDVKCCKNSKGNLSVSERFISLKCESKTDDLNKDKNTSNNLVSQGPEIDVYTFTEKVDSPKSILSDFRNPINKNIGRVRPIARVKGTVIDKKLDNERKKFSPHRPIEEVVKQLKANKRTEDLSLSKNNSAASLDFNVFNDEKEEVQPPIVSKSYKMVARKSSITGKPFSPIKFLDQDSPPKQEVKTPTKVTNTKKNISRSKKPRKKSTSSDDEMNTSTFALNTKTFHYTSSEESVSESNDDNDQVESSESSSSKTKKTRNKKYKRITDGAKKSNSKELKELSKDSLIDIKDTSALLGNEKPSKRRLKLLSMWSGPKKHRMASLNALAKVHCLYENESRTHMELGLMKTVDRQAMPSTSKSNLPKKKETKTRDSDKQESTSESEYENKKETEKDSSESSDDNPPQRTLRGVPGIRSAGKYWDPRSSTSSSEDSELESKSKNIATDKKKASTKPSAKSDSDKPPPKMKKTAGVPVKKKRNRNEVVMDLKDMVVQKRMASLNATAILAASYEKRSPKSSKDDTTSDSCSDDSFSQKPKNGLTSGIKSELKIEDTKKECEELSDRNQKVEVIVNQDTDVTITGVYSTHLHEGFCTVSGMQYRISSTSHTQTTATANCEKEGCSREDGSRYTPLSALSSMQPPADHSHHPHPVPELGGLARRAAGCSSAFSAPSPAAHHDPVQREASRRSRRCTPPPSPAPAPRTPRNRHPLPPRTPPPPLVYDAAFFSSYVRHFTPLASRLSTTEAGGFIALSDSRANCKHDALSAHRFRSRNNLNPSLVSCCAKPVDLDSTQIGLRPTYTANCIEGCHNPVD
ncbi:hypothetical protein KGM_206638 [Danaus plexippus plexippus]|uniref:Uncharacterized protein n=1 Tax=Danaus plexippus plexippus TaxID=278856 RepID=A0A212FCC8_DANPL|nr:hypothetical protein KGM_206638 [Danaus plexippus plexippus]